MGKKKDTPQGKGYSGSGSALSTQDRNEPVKGNETQQVNPQLFVRTVNRETKDRGFLRSAHIAAESVYYPNQTRLFDTYEDALLDAYLYGIIHKRISQVVNKNLLFLVGDEEQPDMKKVIPTKVFKDIMRQVVWARMWGINGLEFIPGDKLAFNLIPKKHIKLKTQKITFEQHGLDDGIDYTKLKNIWIIGDAKAQGGNGASHDLGLLLMASYLIMLKKGAVSDWAQFIEIFGSPIMVLKYKGYDMSAKAAADKIIANLASSARITIPEEMNLTFEDGKVTNGDGKLQGAFMEYIDEQLAILLLGNTETTGHSKTGTGAKSNVHAQQQLEIIKDDMDYIIDYLNSDQFMDILRSYNLPVDGGHFIFDREVDIDEIVKKYPVDIALGAAGLPMSKKYLYENYGIPEPEGDGDTIMLTGPAPDPEPDGDEPAATKPKPKKPKPAPQALSKTDVEALLDKKLTAFFGPAL